HAISLSATSLRSAPMFWSRDLTFRDFFRFNQRLARSMTPCVMKRNGCFVFALIRGLMRRSRASGKNYRKSNQSDKPSPQHLTCRRKGFRSEFVEFAENAGQKYNPHDKKRRRS